MQKCFNPFVNLNIIYKHCVYPGHVFWNGPIHCSRVSSLLTRCIKDSFTTDRRTRVRWIGVIHVVYIKYEHRLLVGCFIRLTCCGSSLFVLCWLCWGLTSQSTIFQSYRDGAIASWVINQYFRGVKCLAQGHNTAAVGLELFVCVMWFDE